MSLLEIAETCISGECHEDCKYLNLLGGVGGCDTCCQVKLLRDITLLLKNQNIQEDEEKQVNPSSTENNIEPGLPYSIENYIKQVKPDEIELNTVNKVYKQYTAFCIKNNLIPKGKIIFGRWVCQLLNMEIKQKSVNKLKAWRYILKKEA